MKRLTVIISCLCAMHAYGQKLLDPVWSRPIALETKTDSLGDFFYRVQNPGQETSWNKLQSVQLDDPDVKALVNTRFSGYIPFKNQEELWLVENLGGKVFALNKDGVQRIDHSFSHKNQINSVLFQRNDTLFRFGGYGYFNAKNFMTYFAPQTKEWEYYLNRSTVHPPGLFTAKYVLTPDRLVVFGGQTLNASDPYQFEPNQEIWSFSFSDKRWIQLGQIKQFTELKYQPSDLQLGDTLFFIEEGNLYGFAAEQGVLLKYPQKNTYLKHLPKSSMSIEQGQITYLIQHKQTPEVSRWISEPLVLESEQIVLVEKTYAQPFLGWYLFFALFLAFVVWGLWPRKHLQEPKVWPKLSDGVLEYRRKKVPLNADEASFMELFLSRDQVMVNDMIDLLADRKMVYSQKMKLKDDIVASLNNKLFFLTDSEAFQLVSSKNLEDKRMRLYRLRTPFN